MSREEIVKLQYIIDFNGFKREYGYDKDGRKYLLNVEELLTFYRENNLDGLRVISFDSK